MPQQNGWWVTIHKGIYPEVVRGTPEKIKCAAMTGMYGPFPSEIEASIEAERWEHNKRHEDAAALASAPEAFYVIYRNGKIDILSSKQSPDEVRESLQATHVAMDGPFSSWEEADDFRGEDIFLTKKVSKT